MRWQVAGGDLEIRPTDGACPDPQEQLVGPGLRLDEVHELEGVVDRRAGPVDAEGAHRWLS